MLSSISPSAEAWNTFVQAQPRAHILQLADWGNLKRQYGWDVERLALTKGEHAEIVAGAQILLRKLPAGLGTMAYLPMGPYITHADQWPLFWDAVKRRVVDMRGVAFLKWEPGIYNDGDTPPDFARWDFQPSPQTVQPPRTFILDISDDDDAIMARMNQSTRRKIRKSLKNEVRYYEAKPEDVHHFSDMMQTTGSRNEFGVHEPLYYQFAYDVFVPDHAALILAEHEGDHLAGIMVFAVGDTAWYLYGASSNAKRNLMASYGVQWQAIQWAKARGCTFYDMWGVPDYDSETLESQFQERRDGLWGVYGFKRGWGGEVVRSLGAYDRVYKPLIYQMYKIALNIRGSLNR